MGELTKIAPPERLLLDLASSRYDPSPVAVSLALVELAAEHRMAGLLSDRVDTGGIEVEPEARAVLAAMALGGRHRSQELTDAALAITTELDSLGLEVSVFKGIAVERRWYPRAGARPAFDLDLWLSPFQLQRAREVVELLHPEHPLAGDVAGLVARKQLRSVDLSWNGIPVDLHFDPFKFGVWSDQLEMVWSRTEIEPDGIRVMGEPAQLLVSLVHLNKDRFSKLVGFADVARAVAAPGLADAMWELASAMGVTLPVSCSARVVEQTLRVDLPIPPPRSGWRTWLWHRLWPETAGLLGSDGRVRPNMRQHLIPFFCDRAGFDAWSHLRHVLFPPKALVEYFNPLVKGDPYPIALWRARFGARPQEARSA